VTRLIGGPSESGPCGASDCDGNLKYIFWFIIAGLPLGLLAGSIAVVAARYATRKREPQT
jgi:hypothetical protein